MVEEDHPCSRHHHYYKHSFHCSYFSYEGTHTNTNHMTRTTMIYYQGKKLWWTVFWGIFWISKLDPPWRNFGSLEHQQHIFLGIDLQGSRAICVVHSAYSFPYHHADFTRGSPGPGNPAKHFERMLTSHVTNIGLFHQAFLIAPWRSIEMKFIPSSRPATAEASSSALSSLELCCW